ncbi:hypothetical protein EYF80_064349 [Liparis tanakae]|uniref:Uncharacterized protein n=1 Tax=Liparis tanakae TaxID=230148 RepID=A0A4Z2E9T8_9TELE|nr:hypothetical protein EYF80_064349 [Liparis tanakae]
MYLHPEGEREEAGGGDLGVLGVVAAVFPESESAREEWARRPAPARHSASAAERQSAGVTPSRGAAAPSARCQRRHRGVNPVAIFIYQNKQHDR